MKIKILFLLIFLFETDFILGQTSFLDSTFNPGGSIKGKKEINFGTSESGAGVAVDPLGRVIVLANNVDGTGLYVTRLLSDGNTDYSFGYKGLYTNIDSNFQQAFCILRQPDGKILIGGSRSSGNYNLPLIIRLNSDGTTDTTFANSGEAIPDFGLGYFQVKKMVLQDDGRIVLLGVKSNEIFVARLRTDGSLDYTYNSPSGYRFEDIVEAYASGLDINSSNELIVAAKSGAGSYTHLFMYRSDGSYNLNFNNSGKDSLSLPSEQPGGVLFQPDGKIVLGTSDYSYFSAYRFYPNGIVDTTFGINGKAFSPYLYAPSNTNILLDNKDKIILTGGYSYNGYAAARFNSDGSIDSSFANNGLYTDYPSYPAACNNSCLGADNKIFLVGGENNNATIEKIENRQVMHILGDDYVLPGTSEAYEVKVPSSWGYTYRWEFTGGDYFFVPDSIGQKVLIYFNNNATDGKLICYGESGGYPYVKVEMEIKINNNPSQASLLTEVQCPQVITDCYNNYISHFKLNLISNDSSTCNSTGYSDFTRSQWVDTLISGAAYSASVRAESSDAIKYAAIWIDYNNDGNFDSTSEFVSETFGSGPILTIKNIILKNKEGYSGPKRLRVRCNPYGFKAGDACPQAGEIGETEDYLIVIQDQDKLQAPEIFTPNEDGKNDFFVIRGVDPEFSNSLTVFDRYGEVVFTTSNYENNWDGKSINGGKVNPGTYYYFFKNNDEFIRGFVELRY